MQDLINISNDIRKDIIEMIYEAKSGHPGGSLSCVEILVALYFKIMDLSLDENNMQVDRFILSKGHASPAYYAVLSKKGYIKHEDLITFRKYDSYLEGHPSNKIKGVEISTGSLGQGMSVANGMALEKKLSGKNGMIYCLLGDGEIEEGQVWEAFMSAHKYNLSNVVAIIDNNGLQIDGTVESVKKLDNLYNKLASFGFNVKEVNGHDLSELIEALNEAKLSDKPNCIIAKTIKGKGVSFMENQVQWHGKSLSDDEYRLAMKELGGNI